VSFKEVLAQVMEWLQQDKRLSYRALKRQFALDDAYLDDLKAELIEVRRVAVEEDGRVRSCPSSLRVNTRGLPSNRHKNKKA
jgi:hypothetical protein